MLTILAGAVCLAVLAGGAWLVGRTLVPAGLFRGGVEDLALGSVLGFLVVGQVDFLLRLCGWRLTPAVLALLVAAALAASLARRQDAGKRRSSVPWQEGEPPVAARPRHAENPPFRARLWRLAPLAALLAAGGTPLLLLALYPAVDPDPGIYHLPYARAFAEHSGLPFLADLRFPVFPQLNELLFAIGLRLHGVTGAHLVESVLALCTALLLWTWGRDAGGTLAGAVAAGLWLGNPLVILLGSTAHVDVGVACFALAGLYCLEQARTAGIEAGAATAPATAGGEDVPLPIARRAIEPLSRPPAIRTRRRQTAWAAMAGGLLGGAAAVKYMGLFFLAAGGAGAAAAAIAASVGARAQPASASASGGAAGRRRQAAAFALAATVVVVPVYGHILRVTGNPIFPFFPQVFGYTEWTHDVGMRAELVQPIPVAWTAATLWAMARFPVERGRAMLAGGAAKLDQLARADRDPPHIRAFRRLPGWGRSMVLLALAATWVRALWRPDLRLAVAVALGSLVVWLSTLEDVQRLDPRYILAAGPPLALATGAALGELAAAARRLMHRLTNRAPRLPRPAIAGVATALALAAIAPGLVFARARARYLGPLPLAAGARLEVARADLPGFAALRRAAVLHGRDSAVYNLDLANLAFYAPGRYLGDAFGPQRYAKLQGSFTSGQTLYQALRGFGADHLLAPRSHLAALPGDPTFAEHFRAEYADDRAVLWELQPLPARRQPKAAASPARPGTMDAPGPAPR